MTTHGSSRYISRRGFSGGLCLNSLPIYPLGQPDITDRIRWVTDQSSKERLKYGFVDFERYMEWSRAIGVLWDEK